MPVADFAQGVTSPFFSMVNHTNDGARVRIASTTSGTNTGKPLLTTGADGKSFFANMLDVVNPLEHLPIVSTIYHAITGNQSGDVEKIAGDTLYGGPIGLLSSVADVAFEKITGKDFGDTMLAFVGLGGDDKDNGTKLAANAKGPDTDVAATAALNRASLDKAMLTPATKLVDAVDTSSLLTAIPPITGLDTAPAQATTQASAAAAATSVATAQAAQSIIDISPQTDALLAALQKNGVTGAMQSQAMDAYRRTLSMNSTPANGAPATLH